MFSSFHYIWGFSRAILLAAFCLLVLFMCLNSRASAWTLEGPKYVGPGSEAESTDKRSEDKKNGKAYQREHKAHKHPHKDKRNKYEKKNDRKRASKYRKDHMACN